MSDLCAEIARMGRGIGNEKRYRLLEALMRGPLTVGDLAKKVRLSQPTVSQHLKVLKTADLVESERRGQEVRYAVNVAYMAALLKRLATGLPKKRT